jgi:ABC-type arginine transport system permease subunit
MYGADEPPHPIMAALSVVFGALAGLAFGVAGFFLATVFPAMLRTALPAMTDAWFLALWTTAMALPVFAFSRVFRKGEGAGARAYASCGIAAILILFAGELTGTISVYPWHTSVYIVPGPMNPPYTPAPAVRR